MAVHNDGQRVLAVNRATPDPCNVCGPALIRPRGYRRQGLHSRSSAATTLAYLPTLDLEQTLDGVLVLTQQPGNGTVACIRQIGDDALDPRRQVLIDLGFGFGRPIVITTTGNSRPTTGLYHRHDMAPS